MSMRVLDLTRRITPSMRMFPGSPQPSFIPWSELDTHGYDSEVIFMSTHTGTHVDAPSHFVQGLASIDVIRVSRLICRTVLIKVERRANRLTELEDLAGEQITHGDTVVIATGWEKQAARNNYMTENPGLSSQAAKYLARKKVNAVGIDGPSIDAGPDDKFVAHNILLSRNILVVENLCNISKITTNRFTMLLSPLKLAGATGSPARVYALV
jgi:kynurenine formamidase